MRSITAPNSHRAAPRHHRRSKASGSPAHATATSPQDVTNATTTNADVDVTFVADDTTAIFFLARSGATANGDSAFFDNFTLRKVIA